MGRSLYSRIVLIWAWVFLTVGLLFCITPVKIGQDLTAWAHLIGLTGTIVAPAGTLWLVLSLSLMSIITFCAFMSAKYPQRVSLYRALLLAKVVSTIGFSWLAFTQGSAWIVCAVGDGFVGLSLWVSFRRSFPSTDNVRTDFARHYAGQAPYYEIWFGKLNIAPQVAFWFRYTLLDGVRQEASSWAILFREGAIQAGKNTLPLDQLAPGNQMIVPYSDSPERFGRHRQVFQLGANYLDESNALGQAGVLAWDLDFFDAGLRFDHVPKTLACLGLAKSSLSSCLLDLRFSGSISDETEELSFEDVPGMIGHIYGKQQAREWTWAHCNIFDGGEDVVFEGLSARIRVAGRLTPPLSSFVLFVEGHRYAFSSVWKIASAQSEFGEGRWSFKTQAGGVTLSGELEAPAGQVALVTYTDTDDSNLWCHNSKLSRLRLHLTDRHRNIDRHFEATDTAAFEIVNRESPNRDVVL